MTTITIAEALTGRSARETKATAKRYRAVLERWRLVELDQRSRRPLLG
ncbi:MAG TPA: hypothetical protein VFE63_15960 [Roseiarcus sp.]|nr:hypothetical protein [Roseiarcus sp.]